MFGNDREEEVVTVVLTTYCAWLNKWVEADAVTPHRYQPRQFMVHNEDEKLWGSYNVQAIIPGWYDIWILTVTDGDEGGPAQLTAWITDQEDVGPVVVHLVQEFDTYVQSIYDATRGGDQDGFLSTPS